MTEDQTHGVLNNLSSMGKDAIRALPAQFLALVICNTVFIIGLLWFVNNQNEQRTAALTPILQACMQRIDR